MRTALVRKALSLGLLLFMIVASAVSGLSPDLSSDSVLETSGTWLYVGGSGPGNYTRIQDALDNASTGDTVYVYSGTYNENIVIETEGLTLMGENKATTTICSRNSAKNTTKITALHVTLQGFTIKNATGSNILWDMSGVFICSSYAVILDNVIRDNRLGLCTLNIAYNVTICNNSFLNDGILFGNYEHTPTYPEVPLDCFQYTVYNNTVNGKPLYYFKNIHDFVVPADAGQVILSNCTNVTVTDINLTHCNFPIMLNYCQNCHVEHNTVEDTYGEIITMRSENCTFQHNTVDQIIFGVCLDQKSHNNLIRYNTVSNSTGGVMVMIESANNVVYGNTFLSNMLGIGLRQGAHHNTFSNNSLKQNDIGLYLTGTPYDNVIENNTFMKNTLQVQSIDKTRNYYNNNYWNRPRVFPKCIFGWLTEGQILPMFMVPYCICGVDWHPLKTVPVRVLA